MQIILSPAKLMDFSANTEKVKPTKPLFPENTKELVSVCRQLSVQEIADTMKINPTMAQDVYNSFQSYNLGTTPRQPAALAYNGIAYKGLNAVDFTMDDFDFAQQHLNIISGLYGILRPLDEIRPYRLEMQRKIVPDGYKTLYDFWQKPLGEYFFKKLRKDDLTIINVASNEYSKTVKNKLLPEGTRVIDIRFLQLSDNGWKQVVVHSKKARGLISRFIIKNRLVDPEEVKGFDYENYFFYPSLSDDNTFTFVR